ADEHHGEGRKRPDQPHPQLDQVLHQRRFRRLDLLLFFFGPHPRRPPSAALGAGADDAGSGCEGAKSFSVTGGAGSGSGIDISGVISGVISGLGAATGSAEAAGSAGAAVDVALAAPSAGLLLLVVPEVSSLRGSNSLLRPRAVSLSSSTCFFRSA